MTTKMTCFLSISSFAGLLALLAATGCNDAMVGSKGAAAAPTTGVAVIDLDEIGKELGRSEEIKKKIEARRKELPRSTDSVESKPGRSAHIA